MPFPEVERVIYNKNPLDKVICQIKFPPILKIDSEIPAQFQESIRTEFPNYNENPKTKMNIPHDLVENIPIEILGKLPQALNTKNYEFATEDNKWKINLTSTFIAFSCIEYTQWEDFVGKIKKPFEVFSEVYLPSYISRIGLRYIDVINRSVLNLKDSKWNELLKSFILGLLGSLDVEDNVQGFDCIYEMLLSDNESKVRINTSFVDHIKDDEKCFMIDSDFYNNNKSDIELVWNKLDYFNKRATRLIQWCITKKLHDAMEPQKIC